MSWEGYQENICENGHFFTSEARQMFDETEDKCPDCKGKIAFWHLVDQTNDEGITLDLSSIVISGEEIATCNLGHVHVVKPAVYRIPKNREDAGYLYPHSCDGPLGFIEEDPSYEE